MNYSLDGVSKHFVGAQQAVPALEGVSLSIARGEQMTVLGSSGAGKSTLFRLLNATLRPTTGSISVDGYDLGRMSGSDLRRTRRRVGTIYQQHNLVPSLTALQNTLCGALGRWSLAHTFRSVLNPAKQDLEQAVHALDLVGLAGKQHSRADELSGGQQQRVAIARVLMQEPEVILADEPIASLDPALADEILSLIVRLGTDGKRTLVVALHKVELALEHFPRVVGLRSGSVCFDQPAAAIHRELLNDLYRVLPKGSGRSEDGNGLQREFGCAR